MGITVKLLSQKDEFGGMYIHCDDEYIIQEGETMLSQWHVKQCAQPYLESSLCAKTALSQWKPSGAFS